MRLEFNFACAFGRSDYLDNMILQTAIPIALAVLVVAAAWRAGAPLRAKARRKREKKKEKLKEQRAQAEAYGQKWDEEAAIREANEGSDDDEEEEEEGGKEGEDDLQMLMDQVENNPVASSIGVKKMSGRLISPGAKQLSGRLTSSSPPIGSFIKNAGDSMVKQGKNALNAITGQVAEKPVVELSEEAKRIPRSEQRRIAHIFRTFDKSGDGEIDRTELFDVVKMLGQENITAFELDEMIEEADTGGDDTISFVEFLEIFVKGSKNGKFHRIVSAVESNSLVQTQDFLQVFLIITFVVLISSSTAVIHFFRCHDFPEADGGTKRYLYKDYSVDCDGDKYQTLVPYAVLCIFIFPIGIPALYATLLYRDRRFLSTKRARELEANLGNRNIGHLLFLVQNYRPEYYWFEIAESARRLILGVLVGLLSSESPTTGPTIAFLVSIGMIYVYLIWGPGPSPDDNRIEAVMSYSLALLFTSALLIMAATSASDDENSAAAPEDGGNAEDGDAASSASAGDDDLSSSDEDLEQELFGAVLVVILMTGPLLVTLEIIRSFCAMESKADKEATRQRERQVAQETILRAFRVNSAKYEKRRAFKHRALLQITGSATQDRMDARRRAAEMLFHSVKRWQNQKVLSLLERWKGRVRQATTKEDKKRRRAGAKLKKVAIKTSSAADEKARRGELEAMADEDAHSRLWLEAERVRQHKGAWKMRQGLLRMVLRHFLAGWAAATAALAELERAENEKTARALAEIRRKRNAVFAAKVRPIIIKMSLPKRKLYAAVVKWRLIVAESTAQELGEAKKRGLQARQKADKEAKAEAAKQRRAEKAEARRKKAALKSAEYAAGRMRKAIGRMQNNLVAHAFASWTAHVMEAAAAEAAAAFAAARAARAEEVVRAARGLPAMVDRLHRAAGARLGFRAWVGFVVRDREADARAARERLEAARAGASASILKYVSTALQRWSSGKKHAALGQWRALVAAQRAAERRAMLPRQQSALELMGRFWSAMTRGKRGAAWGAWLAFVASHRVEQARRAAVAAERARLAEKDRAAEEEEAAADARMASWAREQRDAAARKAAKAADAAEREAAARAALAERQRQYREAKAAKAAAAAAAAAKKTTKKKKYKGP